MAWAASLHQNVVVSRDFKGAVLRKQILVSWITTADRRSNSLQLAYIPDLAHFD